MTTAKDTLEYEKKSLLTDLSLFGRLTSRYLRASMEAYDVVVKANFTNATVWYKGELVVEESVGCLEVHNKHLLKELEFLIGNEIKDRLEQIEKELRDDY